ncbi:MAG: DUF4838 domain-containing protein [Lentisphaeria bacterium]|nr:DUF4838 domain-containing protein [Lentisphaeria bacterium]
MKHWKSTVAVLAALALAGCNTTAEKKEPVKNTAKPAGKTVQTAPKAAFKLGAKDMNVYFAKDRQALAAEMAGYLTRIYGKKFTPRPYGAADAKKPGIFVGIRPAGVKITVDEKKEFCGRHVTATQLYLFGNKGKLLHGTAFSVYDFLEKECGVRWLWPGELGTIVDPQKPKSLPAGTTVFVPAFERRMTNSFSYGMAGMPAKERNDLNLWLDHQKMGTSLFARGSGFQHSFKGLMPRSVYGKEHPEYYALVTPAQWIGEPKPDKPTRRNDDSRTGPWQVCTSNPDVRRIIAEKIAAPKDGMIRSISPNDGFGFCECPNCLKQDGKPRPLRKNGVRDMTNRMYDFAEDIAKQVHKKNPNAKVGMFAYSFYDGVPDRKIQFPGNMYLSFCYMVMFMNEKEQQELDRHLEGLAATGGRVIGREYWGTHYTMNYPLSHSRKIDRNLKLLYKVKAAGIYGETGKDFAARASDLYILMKLSWDPTLKREDILHDFCNKGFGPKAGPVMYELFEKIEDWVEKTSCHFEDHRGPNYKYYDNAYAARNRAMADCFNDDFQKMCEAYYKKALKLADTPERKARIEFIQRGTRMAKYTTGIINAYADLAAIGLNMALTQPSGKQIRMEKKNLQKVVANALRAGQDKTRYYSQVKNDNAFGGGASGPHYVLGLRPWKILAEKARLDLSANRFNYMVNGAFEYNAYSWTMTGANGGKLTLTHECNHDADDNYMVQCHAGQAISLQADLPAGGSAELIQQRKISPAQPQIVTLRMFVKCAENPLKYMTVKFAGQTLKGILMPAGAEDGSGWYEVRFKQIQVPAGDHEFSISFKNNGKKAVRLNLDDLVLRMKEAR